MIKYWLFYISVKLKFNYVRVEKMIEYYEMKKINRWEDYGVK